MVKDSVILGTVVGMLTFVPSLKADLISGDQFFVTFIQTGPCFTAYPDSNPAQTQQVCPDADVGESL